MVFTSNHEAKRKRLESGWFPFSVGHASRRSPSSGGQLPTRNRLPCQSSPAKGFLCGANASRRNSSRAARDFTFRGFTFAVTCDALTESMPRSLEAVHLPLALFLLDVHRSATPSSRGEVAATGDTRSSARLTNSFCSQRRLRGARCDLLLRLIHPLLSSCCVHLKHRAHLRAC